MLPDRCGVREMAPPAAHVNAPPGSRISPLCNGCATARSRRQALVARRDARCSFARMKLWERLLVAPGRRVHLAEWDPEDTLGQGKDAATEDALAQAIARLDELQYVMYADHRHALLVVLQGMDAAGKDGTIRQVMAGFNPQGCRVTALKRPSAEEADHDFLWRIHRAVPAKGDIAIFNRSHYEDVLVARVRKLVPREVWSARYDQINGFEALLAENRSEEHTSELQSQSNLVCRLLLEKKKNDIIRNLNVNIDHRH